MFLSSMESILMVKMLSIDYIQVIFNMMKVWYLFYSSLESIESANQILPHVIQLSNDIVDDNPLVIENEDDFGKLNDNNWISIIVKERLFEEMEDELIMNDYTHVQFIHIQEDSFKNISSLTISNLPKLKFLIIEDNSFYETTNLTLSSIF